MKAGLFLGADPGLRGAIALVDGGGRFVLVEDMPVMPRGRGVVKNEVDAAALARLLRPYAPEIRLGMVEAVTAMPKQGSASTFSLGHSLGTLVGVLQTLGIPLRLESPSAWKRAAGITSDKDLARAAAIRLWPDAPLSRKKDADRAEALLMARHAAQLSN